MVQSDRRAVSELAALSIEEKKRLLRDIWKSLPASSPARSLRTGQAGDLERLLADHLDVPPQLVARERDSVQPGRAYSPLARK